MACWKIEGTTVCLNDSVVIIKGKLVGTIGLDNDWNEVRSLKVQKQIMWYIVDFLIPFLGKEINVGVELRELESFGLEQNQI